MKKLRFRFFLTLTAMALLPTATSFAGKRSLWDGLVVFNVPAKAVVQPATYEGWDEAYAVVPRDNSKKVAAVIIRKTLSDVETQLSTEDLAGALKQQLEDAGVRVSRWKLDLKKQQLTGSLNGKVEVPWSDSAAKAVGDLRFIRVYANELVGVVALGSPAEFGQGSSQPFKQVVKTFRTPKPGKTVAAAE
jgi:hypothetical protein